MNFTFFIWVERQKTEILNSTMRVVFFIWRQIQIPWYTITLLPRKLLTDHKINHEVPHTGMQKKQNKKQYFCNNPGSRDFLSSKSTFAVGNRAFRCEARENKTSGIDLTFWTEVERTMETMPCFPLSLFYFSLNGLSWKKGMLVTSLVCMFTCFVSGLVNNYLFYGEGINITLRQIRRLLLNISWPILLYAATSSPAGQNIFRVLGEARGDIPAKRLFSCRIATETDTRDIRARASYSRGYFKPNLCFFKVLH